MPISTAPATIAPISPFQPKRRTPKTSDQHRDHDQRGAPGRDIGDVEDEQQRKQRGACGKRKAALAQHIERDREQPERADQELRALRDVVAHRNAGQLVRHVVPLPRRQIPFDLEPPRDDQQHGARDEKSVKHRRAAAGAAELRQQQRDHQQLEESVKAREPLGETDIGPEHADRRGDDEQHRQAAGRGHELAPQHVDAQASGPARQASSRSGSMPPRSTTAAQPRPRPRASRRRVRAAPGRRRA